MWDCENCGTQAIAASLDFCPVCRDRRPVPEMVMVGEHGPEEVSVPPGTDITPNGETGGVW